MTNVDLKTNKKNDTIQKQMPLNCSTIPLQYVESIQCLVLLKKANVSLYRWKIEQQSDVYREFSSVALDFCFMLEQVTFMKVTLNKFSSTFPAYCS